MPVIADFWAPCGVGEACHSRRLGIIGSKPVYLDTAQSGWPAAQEKEIAPVIADFWERAEFPHHLMPRLATLGLGGATLKGYGCPGQSVLGAAMGVIEVARVDGSISTFFLVHNSLAVLTIGA